ncbi:redoxin domain-containing protein [Gammaproteobacteria bacterium]|jgi:peroxiredoxin|nr:redoxin domain-containing protein [Gammaproteobacteria bacterium]
MKPPGKLAGPRLRKLGSLLLNVAVIAGVFAAVSAFQARNMLAADRQPAPELQLVTLEGTPYALADLPARPVLIYFFAPWCRVCAASADNLTRLRGLREADRLEILTVALDWQSVGELQAYAARHELNVPVLLGNADVARDWHVYAFPTYYVLDSEQRVVRRDIGYSTQLGLWWRSWAVD